jgi:hypothetical protein
MGIVASFNNFRSRLNEETAVGLKGYTKDDVENAFRAVEDDLTDYYSVDEDNVKVTLEWTLKYGSLDIESSLDHVEFNFDVSGFTRLLVRNLEQDPEAKGPRFSKEEVERAIEASHNRFDVFVENIEVNVNDVNTTLEVNEDRYSTELTVTGKLEEDSLDVSDASINTEEILERIITELYKTVASRIDFS